MTGASQELRNGVATGAGMVAERAQRLIEWGIPITAAIIARLATGVAEEYGGADVRQGRE